MVKLIVGNLPPSATNQSLKELFHEYDDLKDYKLISNYGFVYLETEESAMHAVYNLNGIEYRGFQVTVDYVGDSRSKRKLPTPAAAKQFSNPSNPIQGKPVVEHGNPNPYNLSYSNGNGDASRNFNFATDDRYGQQQSMQLRNTNPYNLPFQNANIGAPKPFKTMQDNIYGQQQFQDYNQPIYHPQPYPNNYNRSQGDPYDPASQYNSYEDCAQQYIPEEEYFSSVPPSKRLKTNQYLDNNGYGYPQRQPREFMDYNYPQFRQPQPRYDGPQVPMRPSYQHPRNEPLYRPRGRKMYQPNRSYIDEYEDDQDYTEVDPYPSYLKQYKK